MADPDYFTLASFRDEMPDMDNATTYPDARVLRAAKHITAIIEREVGTSFIARTATAEKHNGGTAAIILRKAFPIEVDSATENGVTVTDSLAIVNGILRRYSTGSFVPVTWTWGVGNVAVTYTHGYTSTLADVPGDIAEAAMQGTRSYLLEHSSNSSVLDRRSSMTNEVGTTSFVLAGEERPTGYPEVDAVIVGWRKRLNPMGFR